MTSAPVTGATGRRDPVRARGAQRRAQTRIAGRAGAWLEVYPWAAEAPCAADAWHGRGLVCYARSSEGMGESGGRKATYQSYGLLTRGTFFRNGL